MAFYTWQAEQAVLDIGITTANGDWYENATKDDSQFCKWINERNPSLRRSSMVRTLMGWQDLVEYMMDLSEQPESVEPDEAPLWDDEA